MVLRAMADVSPAPGPRELPHLSTFARAAERGSFTDAAADLGVTQAAVSQRIAALERELRVSLFDRRAGRIALTEAGERLYELARTNPRPARGGQEEPRRLPPERLGRPADRGKLGPRPSATSRPCSPPSARSSPRSTCGPRWAIVARSRRRSPRASRRSAWWGRRPRNRASNPRPSGPIRSPSSCPRPSPGELERASRSTVLAREPLIIREPGSGTRCALKKGLEAGRVVAQGDDDVTLEMGSNAAIKDAVQTRARGLVRLPLDGRARALGGRAGIGPRSAAWSLTRYPLRGLSPSSAALACGIRLPPLP